MRNNIETTRICMVMFLALIIDSFYKSNMITCLSQQEEKNIMDIQTDRQTFKHIYGKMDGQTNICSDKKTFHQSHELINI